MASRALLHLRGDALTHPPAHAVMMMVVVTYLVRMRFGQRRGKDDKRDGCGSQNLCNDFHYFFR
jgi:hypothetical protein